VLQRPSSNDRIEECNTPVYSFWMFMEGIQWRLQSKKEELYSTRTMYLMNIFLLYYFSSIEMSALLEMSPAQMPSMVVTK